MDIMTKEESYADRRQLFKNIWETAMQIDEKDVDTLMGKPKVIKTLRLDEVDRCVIGKKKKERIKNLRTVCKKLLDFCDRQDADDMFFKQKPEDKEIADGEATPQNKMEPNLKKIKTYHRRKKVKRAKSLYVPKKFSGQQATSERKDDYPIIFTNTSRNNTPINSRRTTFNVAQRASVTQKRALKVKSDPDAEESNASIKGSATRRKVMRKRRTKRKKSTAPNMTPPGPSGIDWQDPEMNVNVPNGSGVYKRCAFSGASNNLRYFSPPITGRVIVKRIRKFLTDNKIAVTSQV